MEKHPEIIYDGKPCRILTTDKFLNAPCILIENKLGREPWHQKLITQAEYKIALGLKKEPKYDPNKETRLMYGNECIQTWTDLKKVMSIREAYRKKNNYRQQEFIIEQR